MRCEHGNEIKMVVEIEMGPIVDRHDIALIGCDECEGIIVEGDAEQNSPTWLDMCETYSV